MERTRRFQIVWLVAGLVIVIAVIALLSAWPHRPDQPSSTAQPPVAISKASLPTSEPQTASQALATPPAQIKTPAQSPPLQPSEPQTSAHSLTEPTTEDDALIRAQIDERARAIMRAAVHAHGGLRRLLAVHDWTMRAIATFNAAGQPLEVPVTTYIKRPDKLKIEQQIAGQVITAATDGKVAWMQAGGQLLQLPQEKMDALKRQLSPDSSQAFTALSDSAYRFKYLETKEIHGQQAEVIELSSVDRQAIKLYFDTHTHELIQEETQTPQGIITVQMSDFRPVDEIRIAFRVEMYLNNERVLRLVINEMAFDTGLKDEFFAVPVR